MLLPKASEAAPRPTPTTARISAYSAADAPRVSFNNRLIMSLPATRRGTRSEGIQLNIESSSREAIAPKVPIWDKNGTNTSYRSGPFHMTTSLGGEPVFRDGRAAGYLVRWAMPCRRGGEGI
jgi:hypothetical protein